MKRICWLLLLAGLCPALRAEAREPFAGSAKKPPAGIISVDLRGDTLVYLSVPGRRGLYVDAEGQRYRFRPEPAVVGPPHALSFEIGAFAASGMRGMFYTGGCCDDSGYPRFPGEFPGEQRYYEGPLRTTGALGIAYGYRVKHWLEVGASFTYTGFYRNLLRTSDGGVASRQREHYLTLMPYVRLSWVNGRMVQCYSSLHLGYQLESERYYSMNRSVTDGYFAGHLTLVGVRVGQRLFGYGEIGVGMRGVFVAGIGYRFGNYKM